MGRGQVFCNFNTMISHMDFLTSSEGHDFMQKPFSDNLKLNLWI